MRDAGSATIAGSPAAPNRPGPGDHKIDGPQGSEGLNLPERHVARARGQPTRAARWPGAQVVPGAEPACRQPPQGGHQTSCERASAREQSPGSPPG
jgi:hypothetical protein